MEPAIELTSLLLVGWIAGAELGSWACVQPVVARLPYEQYTERWTLTDGVREWDAMRNRWHAFQGIRGLLFGVAFLLLGISAIASRP